MNCELSIVNCEWGDGLGYYFTKGTEADYYGYPVKVSQSAVTVPTNISLGFWLDKR